MLNLETLESRETPSRVWVGVGIIEPNPYTGEPAQTIRLVEGDNPHSPDVWVDLNGKGRWDGVGANS